ncbi:MAG: MFS transporter, partial [Planctomycetota bacterium]
ASPILGAIADRTGRRKIWLAGFSVMLVAGAAGLWAAEPGRADLMPAIVACVVLLFVGAEFTAVFTNAMLPSLVAPARIGRVSGVGWSAGYAGGLVALAVFLLFVLPVRADGTTLPGFPALFGFAAGSGEAERFTGPFAALWYLMFVLPLFFFTPDTPRGSAGGIGQAVVTGLRELKRTLASVRQNATLVRFLIARMLYVDGLNAIFAFGGIYATAIFGWSGLPLALFACVLSVTGLLGALVGGLADDRFGPRAIILTCLVGLLVTAGLALSIDGQSVLFGAVQVTSADRAAAFTSPAEFAFIAATAGIGLFVGPLQASSRSYMARLTPPEKAQEYFGFFAFAGRATSFAAPLAIATATVASGSQRIGMAMIALFLLAGFALMLTVERAKR